MTVAPARFGGPHQPGASSAPSHHFRKNTELTRRMAPKPHDVWRWLVMILDDVLVEKFWYRLRRGDARGAVRSITELIAGFPGCWLVLAVLVVLGVFLVRSL